ncbi:MAG: LPXTG cell wall anchor domain-containing protein, partial [Bifidobacteriaceae bacterium]|nr:LPXTG cell wall anchor domain-containing protein [Bifidobacteriaceae bacterium]
VITDTPIGAFMVLKTAIPAVAHPGDVVSYQIDLVSTGAAPVEVDLVDYLAWVLDDSEIVEEPQINEATIDVAHARRSPIIGVMGELDSGSEATLEYKVRVPEDADGDDLMVNVVIEPLSAMALPEERPECGAFAEGSCTTTPVIWPETALPVTGSGSVWPVTTAALVALLGGCGFLVARRVKLRHR